MSQPPLALEEQVGQVILAEWTGEWDRLALLVARSRAGGVMIPAGARLARDGVGPLVGRLQQLSTYPLLCAADLAHPAFWCPPGAALAAARQPALARRCGEAAGALARAQGVQLLLGPTFDVPRAAAGAEVWQALGENPALAASLAAAFTVGCREGGALAVGRYFPGRGALVYDAARAVAALPQSRQVLEKADLLPYVEAARAGLAAVMSGHLHVAALDSLPNRLATHSSAVVEGLLRGTLGYDGLLLTDRLEAAEVAVRYDSGQAAVLAFAAGHDVLVTANPEEVYRALYEVLLNGDVPRARLEEAVRRVWAAKGLLGLGEEPAAPTPPLAEDAVQRLESEVAHAGLVAVRGRRELVPGRRALVLANRSPRPDGSDVAGALQSLARRRLAQAVFHSLDPRPTPRQVDGALAAAAHAEVALIFLAAPSAGGARRASREALVAMAQALKRMDLTVAVVLLGDAQALLRFRSADFLLYLPADGDPYLEAAFDYVLGRCEAPGRLPVSIPQLLS